MKCIVAWDKIVRLLEPHRHLISSSPDFSLVGAREGRELVELHRTHQAHLLILDTRMPGLAPESICHTVRVDPVMRKVSLIVIGDSDSVPTLEQCMANRSFIRPLNKEDFLGAVRTLFNVAARKDYRVLIGVQLSGMVGSTPFFGRSENISPTGILFSCNRIFDLGDVVQLMFVLPGQGKLHTEAEILRAEPSSGKDPKYGARFIDPGLKTARLMEEFIRKRLR